MKKQSSEKDVLGLPAETQLPLKLNILPIGGRPIFPGIFTPLMINSPEDIKVIEESMAGDGFIGIVMLREDKENPSAVDLHKVGTVARIIKKINLPDGGVNAFVSTLQRFKIRKVLSGSGPVAAAVDYLDDEEDNTFEVKALTRALISEMKEISENNPMFSEEMRLNMVNIDHPGKIADFIVSILNIDKEDQQKVLEMTNVRKRMEQVLVYIKKEQEIFRVQKKIQTELNEKVEKNQREYFLREEMKSIQEELGIAGDSKTGDYQKFKSKIDSFNFTGEVKETLDSELEKFRLLDPHDPDYNMSRNYLETVTALPWNDEPLESYSIEKASKILEGDHYGLEDVKKRIIEHLAVRMLKNDGKGSVLILVGPPGVGKTSVGRSIANAMNKKFFRFSVGGEHDESKIKGFRRTYIGSMPGQIIEGLKITKSKAPVFMIDEVDKMNASAQGDPSAALLEVLDPEQNSSFRDSYLNLPFDLSKVFFILTANTLDTIPRPLLDRAEIIELSGYIDQEKIEIAQKYLVPRNLVKNGFKKSQVKFSKSALALIATEYAREAGVRNFEKCIDKINRKLAAEEVCELEKKGVSDSQKMGAALSKKSYSIGIPEVRKYLGKAVFDESQIKSASVPGTAVGLAWTSMGGDTLLLESIAIKSSKGGLQLTGQMGDVMKESAQIAMNWSRQHAIEEKIKDSKWFDENTVHLHIPEGATPKDGPSAGITMAVAFTSLLKGRKIRPHIAMTGELSLTGQVLPIGGLREKTVAAKRNKIKTVIIPKANVRDLDEIPEHVKTGMKFIPVSHVQEVIDIVF
ncbi:endopeptidase La [Treponema sp.]|uniref:endopeptidase La n=1 Tax=Treponema sp. TaxID=166 RepID=UPI003EFE451B